MITIDKIEKAQEKVIEEMEGKWNNIAQRAYKLRMSKKSGKHAQIFRLKEEAKRISDKLPKTRYGFDEDWAVSTERD